MDGKREIMRIVDALREANWRCEIGGSGHWKAFPPDPSLGMEVLGNTVSDWRAIENIKARLRKKGFDFDRRNEFVPKPKPVQQVIDFKAVPEPKEEPKPPLPQPTRFTNVPLHAFENQLPDGNSVLTLYITSAIELVRIKTLLGLTPTKTPKRNPYVKRISGPMPYTHSSRCHACGDYTPKKRPDRPGEYICCPKIECHRKRNALRMREANARKKAQTQ